MKAIATYKHLNPFVDESIATIKRTTSVSEFLKQDLLEQFAKEATPEGYYLQKIEHPEYSIEFDEHGEQLES